MTRELRLKGIVRTAEKTKDLAKILSPQEIALISHRDMDQLAALSLVEKRAKAVLNRERSISGRFPTQGPRILLDAGIPLFDEVDFYEEAIEDAQPIEIIDGSIYQKGRLLGQGEPMSLAQLDLLEQEGYANLEEELGHFVENTLAYAIQEKSLILHLQAPKTRAPIQGRHVLVVVRGPGFKEDLHAITSYIIDLKPVIIGVDGGADGCLDLGFCPDVIIGDMDSVSDRALQSGAELIVHAYPNGQAPGMKRIEELDLIATLFPAPGTSEDIALLLAYEHGAQLISVVGGHSSFMDFMEKGRAGMGSTFLVRLKIGEVLVDAKGVNKLYQGRPQPFYLFLLLGAALLPVIILLILSPPLNYLVRLLILTTRIFLGL